MSDRWTRLAERRRREALEGLRRAFENYGERLPAEGQLAADPPPPPPPPPAQPRPPRQLTLALEEPTP